MFKQGVNEMLQGKLDEHLGYEKHAPEGRGSGKSRNDFSSKRVKSETLGDVVLSIQETVMPALNLSLFPSTSA
jgi:putative transposase